MRDHADAIDGLIAAGDWQVLLREAPSAPFRDLVRILQALGTAPTEVSEPFFAGWAPGTPELVVEVPPDLMAQVAAAVSAGLRVRLDHVTGVRLHPNQRGILLLSEGEVLLCGWPHAIPIQRLEPPSDGTWQFSADERQFAVATASAADRLDVWTDANGGDWRRLGGIDGPVRLWLSIPARGLVVAGTEPGSVIIWRDGEPEPMYVLKVEGGVDFLKASDSGDFLIAGSLGRITTWSLDPCERIATLAAPMWEWALSSDGRTLAGFKPYADLRVWDLPEGNLRFQVEPVEDDGWGMLLSPDGRLITVATSSCDDVIRVYRATNGERVATIPLAGIAYAFSSDGRFLVNADWDGVAVWNALTMREHVRFDDGFRYSPVIVSMSPDSRFAACGGWGNPLRLIDIETRSLVATSSSYDLQMPFWGTLADSRPGLASGDLRGRVEGVVAELDDADPVAALLRLWLNAAAWQAGNETRSSET